MVRAPCCEKMGLKKGPWTAEEDQILVSYIQRYGHGNWRALPKQAGLLRCGKSCRLRWTNYLRPDIKRGNFTKEEEETIISLHELLGNRWSAIAARLPGRTDNEIKNVWHTHLKKRLKPKPTSPEPKKNSAAGKVESEPTSLQADVPPSPPQSSSTATANSFSSSTITTTTEETHEHAVDPPEKYLEIMDESFWSEALSLDSSVTSMDCFMGSSALLSPTHGGGFAANASSNDDDLDYWLRVFMEAGELPMLPSL
ncbi:hypothetical protein Taro_024657 [Colocasia esculenta]|uniref:Uncharacterized protein n=1 Tax=Colocasia esculenta TaxID=4460 RepID=A0A843VEA3_COLES|nr:hypothetical protein [Colocasia esculenta]